MPQPRWNVLVFAGGSSGDVHPPLAIAKRLRDRGHRVLFITNPYFEGAAAKAGVEFAGIGTADEYIANIQNPDLWKIGKGVRILFESMLRRMPDTYRLIADRYVPGETLVVAPGGMLGARIANEKLGVPLAQFLVETPGLRSLNEQPGVDVPPALMPIVRPLRRALLAALDRWMFDPMLTPRLNAFRAELSMAPVHRVFRLRGWMNSPDLILGLFPDWFLKPQPDWPENAYLSGFPLADHRESQQLPPDLARFLDAGDAPIVFTWGTAMRFADRLLGASVEACRLLGRRGLLLTQFPEQVPKNLPDTVRHFVYVPFSLVLPRAAAVVHHGGVGTTSQAFAAGIPQLVTPFNFDQPDNAIRVRRLGAGDSMSPRKYVPATAAKKLGALLDSASVAAACRSVKEKLEGTDGIGEACRLIELHMSPIVAASARRSGSLSFA